MLSKAMVAAVANRTSRVRMTFLQLRDVAKLGARKCPEHDMAAKENNWGNRPKTIGLKSNTDASKCPLWPIAGIRPLFERKHQ